MSSLPSNNWKFIRSIEVGIDNLLTINAVQVSVLFPSFTLPPVANMSFTAVELAGWVHDPNAFDSDSSYDINQEETCIL